MKKAIWAVLALALTYFIWGALFGPIMFDVVVLNTSETSLDRVTLKFEQFDFRFGILSSQRGDKTYGMQISRWPSTLKATWIVDGHPEKVLTQELIVPKRLHAGRKEKLDLVVEFADAGVRVYPRVREDLAHGLNYRYKE